MNTESFEIKLNELNKIGSQYRRFYHVKSMMNFLKYYKDITNKSGQQKAYDLINAYFDEIEKNPIFDFNRAQFIFTKYISP